ncbi:MAG TPA: type II secretion system protein [Patescibacteria group bacterium]|nr:type II secretion system protein [Patescibacteria group bacterium]
MRNKNQSGFTLIELLVVIAIIGLLASVVLLALNSARAKSRDAKRLADVRQLASAFELFFNDKNSYPTSGYMGTAAVTLSNTGMTTAGLVPTYIGLMPVAPTPADGNCGTGATWGANDYNYAVPTGSNTVSSYTLTFCLGGAAGSYPAGPHTLTPAGIQ